MFSVCNCSSELGLRQSCGNIGIYCAPCRLYKFRTPAAAAAVNTAYTSPALCNGVSTRPNTRRSRGSAILELISTCAGVRYLSCDSSPMCGGSDRNRSSTSPRQITPAAAMLCIKNSRTAPSSGPAMFCYKHSVLVNLIIFTRGGLY